MVAVLSIYISRPLWAVIERCEHPQAFPEFGLSVSR